MSLDNLFSSIILDCYDMSLYTPPGMTSEEQVKIPQPGRFLQGAFDVKKQQNPGYSLRAFARDAGVSAAYVSQVFSGKKMPSFEHAQTMAKILNLSSQHQNILMHSVLYHRSTKKDSKDVIKQLFARSSDGSAAAKYEMSSHDEYVALTHWYHIAILDFLSCKNFKPNPKWIARKLGITENTVNEAVDRLVRLNLIRMEKNKWIKTKGHLLFTMQKSKDYVVAFNKEMMEQARIYYRAHAYTHGPEVRLNSGATIATNPENIKKARAYISEMICKVSEILTEGECTEVYQLNVQMFPLTNPEVKDEK